MKPDALFGGPTTVENMQVLCGPCNWSKGARLESELNR